MADSQAAEPVAELEVRPADLDEPWGEHPTLFTDDETSVPYRLVEVDVEPANGSTVAELIDDMITDSIERFLDPYGEEWLDEDVLPPVEVSAAVEERISDGELLVHRMVSDIYADLDEELDKVYKRIELTESTPSDEIEFIIKDHVDRIRTDIGALKREVDHNAAYMDGRLASMFDHLYDQDHAISGVDQRMQVMADRLEDDERFMEAVDRDLLDLDDTIERTQELALDSLGITSMLAQHVVQLQARVDYLERENLSIVERQNAHLNLINNSFASVVNALGTAYIDMDRVEEKFDGITAQHDARLERYSESLGRNWERTETLSSQQKSAEGQINFLTERAANDARTNDARLGSLEDEVERQSQTLSSVLC